jgi:hypothetical protein
VKDYCYQCKKYTCFVEFKGHEIPTSDGFEYRHAGDYCFPCYIRSLREGFERAAIESGGYDRARRDLEENNIRLEFDNEPPCITSPLGEEERQLWKGFMNEIKSKLYPKKWYNHWWIWILVICVIMVLGLLVFLIARKRKNKKRKMG